MASRSLVIVGYRDRLNTHRNRCPLGSVVITGYVLPVLAAGILFPFCPLQHCGISKASQFCLLESDEACHVLFIVNRDGTQLSI